jgi:uncharacterized protein (DUF2267 family)
MTTTGLDIFDKTVQTTNIWLGELGEELGPDKRRCYHALRAVLFALRDRLLPDQAFHLSAELPMLVRGVFWEGYRLPDKPERIRSREEFLASVEKRTAPSVDVDAEVSAMAVFGLLERHLAPGEVAKIKQDLPDAIRALFPSERH